MMALVWGFVAPWWKIVAGIASIVPKQVWYAVALVVAFMLYGTYTAHRATNKLKAKYEAAQKVEIERQRKVSDNAVKVANDRLAVAEKRLSEVQKELDSAVEYAKNSTNANAVCLPADITRRLQSKPRRR
jgi:hypothetical protein